MNAQQGKAVDRGKRKTCSVTEFARILGIGDRTAADIVSGPCAPAGFWVGKRYRVLTDGIDEWLERVSYMTPRAHFCGAGDVEQIGEE